MFDSCIFQLLYMSVVLLAPALSLEAGKYVWAWSIVLLFLMTCMHYNFIQINFPYATKDFVLNLMSEFPSVGS